MAKAAPTAGEPPMLLSDLSAATGGRRLGWRKKVAFTLLGWLLVPVSLELILQLAALIAGVTSRGPGALTTDGLRVLCLGDSNTYGLYVGRDETYPRQLETLWNANHANPRIEVLNLGFPGANSSQVLRDFDERLDIFDPAIVVVAIGTNDVWTLPVPTSKDQSSSPFSFVARHSRVYRLLNMLAHSGDQGKAVIEMDSSSNIERGRGSIRYGSHEFPVGWTIDRSAVRNERRRALVQNLVTLASRADARGVRLVVLNYASELGYYPNANSAIEEAVDRAHTPFVDVHAAFKEVCPQQPCSEWMFADGHYTAAGNGLLAKLVMRRLEEITLDAPPTDR